MNKLKCKGLDKKGNVCVKSTLFDGDYCLIDTPLYLR